MIDSDSLTYIGHFGKTHGYKGEINLQFEQFDDDLYLSKGLPLFVELDGCYVPFYTMSYRSRGREMAWLVTIEGIGKMPMDLTRIATFEQMDVYGELDKIKELYPDFEEETEFDIEGYEMVDEIFGSIGRVLSFDDSTENMLVDVELPDGREVTLPFNYDFIKEEEPGCLIMKYPEGLLAALLDPDFQKGVPEE